jgi:hypothetical protein
MNKNIRPNKPPVNLRMVMYGNLPWGIAGYIRAFNNFLFSFNGQYRDKLIDAYVLYGDVLSKEDTSVYERFAKSFYLWSEVLDKNKSELDTISKDLDTIKFKLYQTRTVNTNVGTLDIAKLLDLETNLSQIKTPETLTLKREGDPFKARPLQKVLRLYRFHKLYKA